VLPSDHLPHPTRRWGGETERNRERQKDREAEKERDRDKRREEMDEIKRRQQRGLEER
jgi:hypothetical protein